jgi:hypothetical protein
MPGSIPPGGSSDDPKLPDTNGHARARGDYEVGYKKPPKHTQFKKGECANPNGRPKGKKNMQTMLQDTLLAKIEIRENGKPKKVTKLQAIALKYANELLSSKANVRQLGTLLSLLDKYKLLDPPQGQEGGVLIVNGMCESLEEWNERCGPQAQQSYTRGLEWSEILMREAGLFAAAQEAGLDPLELKKLAEAFADVAPPPKKVED